MNKRERNTGFTRTGEKNSSIHYCRGGAMTKRETVGLSYLEEAEDRLERVRYSVRIERLHRVSGDVEAIEKILREIMHIWRVVKFAEKKLSKIERREGK